MEPLFIVIALVIVAVIGYYVITLRKIVPPNSADVVVSAKGGKIYSGDGSVTESKKPEPIYYQWPQWLPVLGVTVRRMPLNIIEIPIKNFETFAKGNPRFTVDVSVYCKIIDVNEAARRFPVSGERSITDSFRVGIQEIVIGAVRTATANYNIEDIIAKREELSNVVKSELETDFLKWGCEITNVAFVSIRDPDDGSSTVVFDISNKKEAEINATSRMEVAMRKQQAEMAEAESKEKAERRKIEAAEQISIREQEMKMNVADQQKQATIKEMDVYRTEQIQTAEIDGDAKIKAAEREGDAKIKAAERQREATIQVAEGTKAKSVLEGEGASQNTLLVGTANANVKQLQMEADAAGKKAGLLADAEGTRAKGTAEAAVIEAKLKSEAAGQLELAKAQEYQQNNAIEILRLEVQQKVATAYATALQNAKVEYIGSGAPEKFLDLFTPAGGLNIGGALKGFDTSSPGGISGLLDTVKTALSSGDIDELMKIYEGLSEEQQSELLSKLVRKTGTN